MEDGKSDRSMQSASSEDSTMLDQLTSSIATLRERVLRSEARPSAEEIAAELTNIEAQVHAVGVRGSRKQFAGKRAQPATSADHSRRTRLKNAAAKHK